MAAFVDGDETRYLIDGNRSFAQVVEEYAPSGAVLAAYTHGQHHLISQSRAGARSWYHADGLGSTRALTSQGGAATDRYRFDADGRALAQSGPTDNAYLYAGEQRDRNLGLDYLRARFLNVNAGRFYGRDRFSGLLGRPTSLSKFLYADADPVNRLDPSGDVTLPELTITVAIASVLQGSAGITAGSLSSKVGRNLRWEGTLEEITIGGVILMGIFAQSECNYSASPPYQIEGSWLPVGLTKSTPSLPERYSSLSGSYFSTSVTIFSPRIFGFNPLALTGGFVGGGVGAGLPYLGATGASFFTMGFGVGHTAFTSPTVGIGFGAEVFTGFSILGASIREPCGSPRLLGSPLFTP